jgi:hypothetical protein
VLDAPVVRCVEKLIRSHAAPLSFYRSSFREAAILIEAAQLIDRRAVPSGGQYLNNAYFYLNDDEADKDFGKQCRNL